LYKSGWVLRERDEDDRRVVYIQLSNEGMKILEKARLERRKIIERYLSHLELEELKQFVHIVEKIVQMND
jgi:DNA-binding MarR family transcriptional regulator